MVKVLSCFCAEYVQHLDWIVDMSASNISDDETVPVWIANSPARGLEPEVMQILGGSIHRFYDCGKTTCSCAMERQP